MTKLSWLGLLLSLQACGGAPDEEPVVADDWQMLVETDWSLGPGEESYYCVRKTVDEDLWVSAFDALAPVGTHHTVLTFGEPDGADGVVDCDSFENHDVMVYGSGVGSRPFEMPEGVAVRVPAGSQLLLNLHVFNAATEGLVGASGVRFRAVEPPRLHDVIEAEAVLMGPKELTIPPGTHSVNGACTLDSDATLFAVAPHMHTLGVHMQVTANDQVIYDAAYDFEDQQVTLLADQIPMKAGDDVAIRCDYVNDTGKTVQWGESTLDEMCFAGVYRYPPSGGWFLCFE